MYDSFYILIEDNRIRLTQFWLWHLSPVCDLIPEDCISPHQELLPSPAYRLLLF